MADPVVTIVRISPREARLEHQSGYTQYPIRYDDGRIAYDRPEIVSKYAKKAVAKAIPPALDKENPCPN